MNWREQVKKIGERSPQHALFVEHVVGCEMCRSEIADDFEGWQSSKSLMCEEGSKLLQKAEESLWKSKTGPQLIR